jgi:hypothetical protein
MPIIAPAAILGDHAACCNGGEDSGSPIACVCVSLAGEVAGCADLTAGGFGGTGRDAAGEEVSRRIWGSLEVVFRVTYYSLARQQVPAPASPMSVPTDHVSAHRRRRVESDGGNGEHG